MNYLLILRGVQGSGKTTYANRLIEHWTNLFHSTAIKCSADDYFVRDGVYCFYAAGLYQAHHQCQVKCEEMMKLNTPLVIIDNTNASYRDWRAYVLLAEKYGYEYRVRVVGETTDEAIEVYAKRNVHSVGLETIQRTAQKIRSNQ